MRVYGIVGNLRSDSDDFSADGKRCFIAMEINFDGSRAAFFGNYLHGNRIIITFIFVSLFFFFSSSLICGTIPPNADETPFKTACSFPVGNDNR